MSDRKSRAAAVFRFLDGSIDSKLLLPLLLFFPFNQLHQIQYESNHFKQELTKIRNPWRDVSTTHRAPRLDPHTCRADMSLSFFSLSHLNSSSTPVHRRIGKLMVSPNQIPKLQSTASQVPSTKIKREGFEAVQIFLNDTLSIG